MKKKNFFLISASVKLCKLVNISPLIRYAILHFLLFVNLCQTSSEFCMGYPQHGYQYSRACFRMTHQDCFWLFNITNLWEPLMQSLFLCWFLLPKTVHGASKFSNVMRKFESMKTNMEVMFIQLWYWKKNAK